MIAATTRAFLAYARSRRRPRHQVREVPSSASVLQSGRTGTLFLAWLPSARCPPDATQELLSHPFVRRHLAQLLQLGTPRAAQRQAAAEPPPSPSALLGANPINATTHASGGAGMKSEVG